MAPPSAFAAPVMVPRAWKVPDSGVVTTSPSGLPDTASGPRVMVKLSSAACSNCDTGFCGWPERLRGASFSSASRIAGSAMAAGVSTVEVPASGGNGGTATSCGRPSCSDDGHRKFRASVAPIKAMTTTAMPIMIVRVFKGIWACHTRA